jgi:hypothetical protein
MVKATTLELNQIRPARMTHRMRESAAAASSQAAAREESRLEWFGAMWCKAFHNCVSHPVCGSYRCWICLREYKVGWEKPGR